MAGNRLNQRQIPVWPGPLQPYRLGLESGAWVSTTDQLAKSTLYANLGGAGATIALYDGSSAWAAYAAAQMSLALSGMTTNSLYDAWCWYYTSPSSAPVVLATAANTPGNLSVTAPTGTAAGDVLVAFVVSDSAATPTGWTLVGSQVANTGGDTQSVFRRVADGTSTDNCATAGSSLAAVVLRCTAGLVVEAQGSTAGTGNTVVAPTETSGGSNRLLLSGYYTYLSTAVTPPGGQTATGYGRYGAGSSTTRLVVGYESVSGSGATGTRTATATGSTNSNLGFSVLLKYSALSTGPNLDLGPSWRNGGQAVSGATNATPVVITASGHGLTTGDVVSVGGVQGNTGANGTWTCTVTASNTFSLTGSVGNGAYASGTGSFASRGTGAGTTELVLQDGAWVNKYAIPGLVSGVSIAAKCGRYLGTVRATGATTTEDSGGFTGTSSVGGKRFVWNAGNQSRLALGVITTSNSWGYTTDTWREAGGGSTNVVEFVCGLSGTPAECRLAASSSLASNSARGAKVGVGLDSTTAPSGQRTTAYNAGSSQNLSLSAQWSGNVGIGYHYLAWLERGSDGTCTFLGNNGGDGTLSGLDAGVWG